MSGRDYAQILMCVIIATPPFVYIWSIAGLLDAILVAGGSLVFVSLLAKLMEWDMHRKGW